MLVCWHVLPETALFSTEKTQYSAPYIYEVLKSGTSQFVLAEHISENKFKKWLGAENIAVTDSWDCTSVQFTFDLPKTSNLLKHGLNNISKAQSACRCLEKLFHIGYNPDITKCSRITSIPNLLSFSEQFYYWKSWNLRKLRPPSIQFWVLVTTSGLIFFNFQVFN